MTEPTLVRLTADSRRKPFDCGNDDLNQFFFEDSIPHSKHLLAVTYAYENEEETVAFFSVLNDSIREEDPSKSKFRKISKSIPHKKRYKSHPAVKVGRFAVTESCQRNKKGRKIVTELMDFVKGWFTEGNNNGCRFITVDAYKESIGFYKKSGFDFLTEEDKDEDTRLMFFDLITFRNIH